MQDGFVKVSAATPDIRVADVEYNVNNIIDIINYQYKKETKLLVFPELCVTGYTCSDLFLQSTLISSALIGVSKIAKATQGMEMLVFIGAPVKLKEKLYNCGIVICNGKILGFVPKTHLPNYGEFYEQRHFQSAPENNTEIIIDKTAYPFGTKLIFRNNQMDSFAVACEICEDLWVADPVSTHHAVAGANIIVNLSSSNDYIGKDIYRRELVKTQSARLICGYIYANSGEGESTTDLIFGGQNFICENGTVLKTSKMFENQIITSEIDLCKLSYMRQFTTTYPQFNDDGYANIGFDIKPCKTELTRFVDAHPFVPSDMNERAERCELIITMQALGLKKRYVHSHSKSLVIGISGGLDSTLALLVCAKTMDMLSLSHKNIVAVTMPCFGTTKRTKNNAEVLCDKLGVTLKTIDIADAVNQHFKDIEQNPDEHNVVYENSQARERTQILMDIANKSGGMVVGTGDLSEVALGWSTYNGDHMSMYAVNCGVPKTLIRHIVKYYADKSQDNNLKNALYDVLDTPVSPELLPPQDGVISQVTEDIVGPYELHDFFLYNFVRCGFEPQKIYRLAKYAFKESYDNATILKWLKIFFRRFFAQQFKRTCIPDGPKVGSVALSPRGDWRMPSDACSSLWLEKLDNLK